jgi:K+-transporting ATPase KdpF subunit
MSVLAAVSALVGVALLVYLVIALLRAEDF